MKSLVEGIQILLIAAIIYPIFTLWDSGNVKQLCMDVNAGMNKQIFIKMAADASVKFIPPMIDNSGKWHSSIVTRSPFSNTSCEIKGKGSRVSGAVMRES